MKVLIVEDDTDLAETLVGAMEKEGYEVEAAYDGDEAWQLIQSCSYDAVILDVMLPEKTGFEVLSLIRKQNMSIPVLMLTAKDDVKSRVKGLDLGADDYVIKPFSILELFARLRVILRRQVGSYEKIELQCGDIYMLPEQGDVFVNKEKITLSKKECKLIEYLLWNKERIVTKEQIFDRIWGIQSDTSETIVDLYVHYLRKKLGTEGAKYIETVRGIGYRLKEK